MTGDEFTAWFLRMLRGVLSLVVLCLILIGLCATVLAVVDIWKVIL